MIQKKYVLLAGALLLMSVPAFASTENFRTDNSKIKSPPVAAPEVAQLWKKWPEPPVNVMEATKTSRRLASTHASRMTGSEDLMSKELKTFRDKLLSARDPETLAAILKEYDEGYDAYPNDLKYVVARIAPMRAMRGFIWRAAPLAHQAVITQETLLGMIRGYAEQVMIFEPDTQWQAYMGFLAIPDAHLVEKVERHDNTCENENQNHTFCVENDVADFFANEVYPKLDEASTRLFNLKMLVETDGRSHPIVFDNRIRFGKDAFGDWNYAASDRFKIVGDAERYSAIARFQRRMAMIAQLAAYNWNGNIALRQELGKHIGIDAGSSGLFGGSDSFSLEGMTREERVAISKKHKGVFALRSKAWMPVAYYHLHNYAYYSAKAWQVIRREPDDANYLLDPELFQGRRDQIDHGVMNLMAVLPDPNAKVSKGVPQIQGAITGKTMHVNMQAFFNEPPADLHDLMPAFFVHHEDTAGLSRLYQGFQAPDNTSEVSMKIGDTTVKWRDYFYGRAVYWNPTSYQKLFPDIQNGKDVAEAQRTLAETRGGRPLLNSLTIFVK